MTRHTSNFCGPPRWPSKIDDMLAGAPAARCYNAAVELIPHAQNHRTSSGFNLMPLAPPWLVRGEIPAGISIRKSEPERGSQLDLGMFRPSLILTPGPTGQLCS